MFEDIEDIDLGGGKAADKPAKQLVNWSLLTIAELLDQRKQIDEHLPPKRLSDWDLEAEMVLQYKAACELQADVLGDDRVPTNQKAQVLNAVTTNLVRLTEMQEKLYTTERHKRIENTLIRVLKKLPEEVVAEFLEEYEKVLNG